jgi:hypothetical protein
VREDRIIRNEALYRDLNERVREVEEDMSLRGLVEPEPFSEYFCECGLEDCMDKIRLSREEYEEARSNSKRFVILPDHLIADVERVVHRVDGRYAIVEKLEGERALALSDPRR